MRISYIKLFFIIAGFSIILLSARAYYPINYNGNLQRTGLFLPVQKQFTKEEEIRNLVGSRSRNHKIHLATRVIN